MNKKQQEEQRRQEDLALRNGLLWAAGAAVLEMVLILMGRYSFNYDVSAESIALADMLRNVLRGMRWAGLAAALVCGVLALVKAKKGQQNKWFVIAALVGSVLMVCGHVSVKYHTTGLQMLYLLVPVLGGLALCYYIYQREFFMAALPVVLGVLGLWFARVDGRLELLITILVGAVLLVLSVRAKKNSTKADLNLAVISAAAAVAVQLVGLLAGGMIAYYLIFVMSAWLFALLVYYTVKMM